MGPRYIGGVLEFLKVLKANAFSPTLTAIRMGNSTDDFRDQYKVMKEHRIYGSIFRERKVNMPDRL
jgi:hypothetical protein